MVKTEKVLHTILSMIKKQLFLRLTYCATFEDKCPFLFANIGD